MTLLLWLVALVASGVTAVAPDPFGVCPPGSPQTNLRCAFFTQPVDYTNNRSGTLQVLVTKLEDLSLTIALGNLWYLNFGCDAWDINTQQWLSQVSNTLNVRIFTPNMRGDGLSVPRLFCADDPQGFVDPPTTACGTQVKATYAQDVLSNYNLDNAATDINSIVTGLAAAQPGPNMLVATGYGALWAQRVVAMFPDLFVRVIISSYTAPPLFDFFANFGVRLTVVRQALTQCSNNWQCAMQLGGGVDPMTMFDNVMALAEVNSLPCNTQLQSKMAPPAGSTWRDVYLDMFTQLVAPDSPADVSNFLPGPTVSLIPALLYRLQRCTAADVTVIEGVWTAIQQNIPPPAQPANTQTGICYPSKVLLANILLNEMVHNDPSETVTAMMTAGVLSRNSAYAQGWLEYYAAVTPWRAPAVNVAQPSTIWFNTKGPVNMALFSGQLDPYSPNSIAASAPYWDGRQAYITLQSVGANPLMTYVPVGTVKVFCVQNNVIKYLTTNSTIATLDPCNGQSMPLDIFGSSGVAAYAQARSTFFGAAASNLWDYSLPASGCFVNPSVPFTPVPPPTLPTPPPTTGKPTPPPTPHPVPTNSTHDSDSNAPVIAGAVLGSMVGLGVIFFLSWKFCRKKPSTNSFSSINYQPPTSTSLYNRYS